ncbi:hypothetical protein HMPREF9466_03167 [Fusobacterium necrophorum subsp. funduliforme 1_1_36S]|nr:hypothetical protein HMPREF9466_03167 [Fusobacterium necrophorum subsp. funduliforme 1_1_36S]
MIAWSHYLIGHAGDLEDKPLVKKILKPYYTVIYIEWEKFKQFKEIFKP